MSTFGPVYIIDFEGSVRSGVVEYGIVEVIADGIARSWTRVCAPTGPVAPRERMTHRLSANSLQEARPLRDDWELFSALRREGPFGAHASAVEDGLLRSVWPTPGRVPAFNRVPPPVSLGWGPWLDTLAIARTCFPNFKNHDLASLVETMGVGEELVQSASLHCPTERRKFHCALFDALAAALILLRIRRFDGWAAVPLEWFVSCGSGGGQADQTELPL